MSYTGRKRYKTKKERYQRSLKRIRMTVIIGLIALLLYAYKNRIYIREWWASVVN